MTGIKSSILLRALIFLQSLSVFLTAESQSVSSEYFTLSFDEAMGTLSAWKSDGSALFSNCVNAIFTEGKIYTSDSRNYSYKIGRTERKDNETVLVITGKDKRRTMDFINRITLIHDKPSIIFEVVYRNVSRRDIGVGGILPLRLTGTMDDHLLFREAEKCLTNGAMYYDAGMIHDLDDPYVKPEPYGETKGGIHHDSVLYKGPGPVESWWNIAVFRDYEEESLLAGYLNNKNSLGRILLKKNNDSQLSLIAESVFNPGFILKSSQEISSDKFALILSRDPYSTLELYSELMSKETSMPDPHIINGWCNWFYTMDTFDENEILQNARFAAKELKPYGLEYIQIDEGFQTAHGEWKGNSRFPHGLKWLCDHIKELGLKPGIWIAPFVISETTGVFREHPEWLIKDEDGNPMRIGPWPSVNTDWYRNESPKRYCLDISHPDAEKWYTDLIDTIANRWGFEMIKVDFVAWTLFSAHGFYDKSATPAQVYRKAMQIMRRTAGDKCHILDCGPGNVTAGYINSMRVEYDQNYGFADAAWRQYFLGSSSSAGAAGKRYFYHNKVWINDIDHICIDLLPLQNARAAATLIGLSGGNTMSGDRLMNLSESKLEVLKKIFPSTIENAIPADLLDNDPQTVFSCHLERDFDQWDVAAFFNPDPSNSVTRKIKIERLNLDDSKTYLAFDFWNERFAGEIKDTMTVKVGPGSVQLYSLHEKRNVPQVISTNRHVKQGAVEISEVIFDERTNTLSGISVSPEGSSHSIFIYLPPSFSWDPGETKIYKNYSTYTARKTEENILRVDLMFENTQSSTWKIEFKRNNN